MAIELNGVNFKITADNSQAKTALKETDSAVQNTATKGESGFSKFAKGAAVVGTAVATASVAAVAGLASIVKKTSDTASQFQDLSTRTGMSAEALQELAFVGGQCDVSLEDLEKSLKTQQKTLNDAASGNKDAAEAYKKLGINIYDSNGKLRDSSAVYQESINKLADLKDSNEQSALATQLFSKAGFAMLPMLKEGSAGIAKLRKEARDTGQVLSNDSVASAESFGDSLEKLQGSIAGIGAKIGVALMPSAQKIINLLQGYLPKLEPIITKIISVALQLIDTLLPPIIQIVEQLLPPLVEIISQVFTALTPLIPVVLQLVTAFLPLIKAILIPLLPLLTPIIKAVVQILTQILPPLTKLIDMLVKNVIPPLMKILSTGLSLALKNVMVLFNAFQPVINNVIGYIQGLIKFVTSVFSGDWAGAWQGIKQMFSNAWNGMLNVFKGAWNAIKGLVSNAWSVLGTPFQNIVNWVKSTWSSIGNLLSNPIRTARDTIKSIIDAIKGFFTNLKLPEFKLPKIKMPHFTITGQWSLSPPSAPRLGIEWYAQGGLFSKPSIIGVGEAGTEAVVPLDKLQGFIDNAISKNGGSTGTTININNPVVRNDADIDALTRQFSKAIAKAQRAKGYAK